MSRRLDDLYEEAGRRIYESQQGRLSNQTCLAAKRKWRSKDVPQEFWDSYCADARAAFSGSRTPTAKRDNEKILARSGLLTGS